MYFNITAFRIYLDEDGQKCETHATFTSVSDSSYFFNDEVEDWLADKIENCGDYEHIDDCNHDIDGCEFYYPIKGKTLETFRLVEFAVPFYNVAETTYPQVRMESEDKSETFWIDIDTTKTKRLLDSGLYKFSSQEDETMNYTLV